MNEQIIVNDVRHWRHIVYDGFYEIGRTIFNADNYSRPIIKECKAPSEMVDRSAMWFNEEDIEKDLISLGFKRKDNITWERE